jgi:hypothetical protein
MGTGPEVFGAEDWEIYRRVMGEARARGIPFALGGAFAYASYTGNWRNTKDLDIYVLPEDRERMIAVLSACGLADYYETRPYDRCWIYRSFKHLTIVDIIWAMANARATVDASWLAGVELTVRGERVRAISAEKLLWNKLYILQRDRCDWPDVLNLIHARGRTLKWNAVIADLGEDLPLLRAALSVFCWVAPGEAAGLPGSLWDSVGLAPPRDGAQVDRRRADWIDSRPWFAPE